MKSTMIFFGILTASLNASAFEIHNVSSFAVDWNSPTSLQQSDGLGCPGVPNYVSILVPGLLNKDFTVTGADSDCKLVIAMSETAKDGTVSTTLTFSGQCASDNDENFTVTRAGSSQQAHISVDAGC